MLRDMRLHCSDPSNFNDPWDCHPWFDDQCLEDPEILEELIAHQKKKFPDTLTPEERQFYEYRLRNFSYQRLNLMVGYSEEHIASIRKRRLYCLTPFPDSTLMWSHYAENHRGICLEFGIDNQLIRNAREVLYTEEYPQWLPHRFDDDPDSAIEMVMTKAKAWEYEQEFRILGLHNNDKATSGSLYVEDGCFALPPNALKAVIAGCNADYDAIRAIVKNYMPDLPVKKIVRIPNQFKLRILSEAELS